MNNKYGYKTILPKFKMSIFHKICSLWLIHVSKITKLSKFFQGPVYVYVAHDSFGFANKYVNISLNISGVVLIDNPIVFKLCNCTKVNNQIFQI